MTPVERNDRYQLNYTVLSRLYHHAMIGYDKKFRPNFMGMCYYLIISIKISIKTVTIFFLWRKSVFSCLTQSKNSNNNEILESLFYPVNVFLKRGTAVD